MAARLLAPLLLGIATSFAPPQHVSRHTHALRRASSYVSRHTHALRRASSSVDVADLGVTMEDLDKSLIEDGASIVTEGYESTSREPTVADDGCAWTESKDALEVVLTIPGLRGQPSGSLAVDVTPTTCTVSSFGFAVWSCQLRGRADAESAVVGIRDGDDLTPVITVCVDKAPGSQRWGGFIADIGEDSLL